MSLKVISSLSHRLVSRRWSARPSVGARPRPAVFVKVARELPLVDAVLKPSQQIGSLRQRSRLADWEQEAALHECEGQTWYKQQRGDSEA